MSGVIVVQPVAVTDAMLLSTTVPETDHAVWSSGTTYAAGARVILTTGVHKVFESLQAGNTNRPPQTEPSWWVEVGPTNRWALFDGSNSTRTAQSTSISYEIQLAASITAIAALNVYGVNAFRVRLIHPTLGTIYDETTDLASLPNGVGWWQWFFSTRTAPGVALATDLPGLPGCRLLVDFTGTTDMAIGVLVFGQMREVGDAVLIGASVGIQDYSRKETNSWGETLLVQRRFAKRASFSVRVPAERVDAAIDFLAAVRATPCLFIGSSKYASAVVYGWYRDFSVTIAYARYSDCSLQIEGLT